MKQAGDAVRTEAEFIQRDRTAIDAIGRYEATPRPVRGKDGATLVRDRAVIVLSDGVKVYLEALDSGRSIRSADEIARFAGKFVRVRGIARKVMPAIGQSPLAPCISDILAIEEVEDQAIENKGATR